MVKSETRRDAEILVRNPSPRFFGKKVSRLKKSKNKPCKNETSRLIKNASEISRSCQNFPRTMFFEVPFTTPICFVSYVADEDVYRRFEKHNYVLSLIHCHGICIYIVFLLLIARLTRLATILPAEVSWKRN